MRSILFPAALAPDPLETLRTAFGDKRELTQEENDRLVGLFDEYEAREGRGDLIAPDENFADNLGDDFRQAYDQTYANKRLEKLRTALKALAKNRCPRCGGSRPGTLDHHLPKTSYAEYSVFPKNLLACCGECNGKKSANVGEEPSKAFLHPYYDRIPPVAFIKAELTVGDGYVSAVVTFDPDAPIADELLKARMRNQFEKVDVNARIASEIEEFIIERAGIIEDSLDTPSPAVVSAYILKLADRADRTYTHGSWQSAILRAMAASAPFCDGGYKTLQMKALLGPDEPILP